MPTTRVVRTGLPVHAIDLDVLRASDVGALHTALRSLRMAVRHIGEDILRLSWSSGEDSPEVRALQDDHRLTLLALENVEHFLDRLTSQLAG